MEHITSPLRRRVKYFSDLFVEMQDQESEEPEEKGM
jgi:hypothetical protein